MKSYFEKLDNDVLEIACWIHVVICKIQHFHLKTALLD